jgi:hypothetical protein
MNSNLPIMDFEL